MRNARASIVGRSGPAEVMDRPALLLRVRNGHRGSSAQDKLTHSAGTHSMPSPPMLEHAYTDVNGVRLHYVTAGTGKQILFLHGFPEFWYAWKRTYFLSPAPARAPRLANGFRKLANSSGKINFVAGPVPRVFSASRYCRVIVLASRLFATAKILSSARA